MSNKLSSEEIQGVSFQLILESGDARTIVHEAFRLMRESKYEEADKALAKANEAIIRAHGSQTDLLQKFADGTSIEIDILMIHAQDHLMTTMTLREVAVELLHLYQLVKQ